MDALPPSAGDLGEMVHWVAPPEVPGRFDARYFSITGPTGLDPVPDGVEAADAWWVAPTALLREWEQGRHKLYWPTWLTVVELARCATVDEVRRLRFDARDPTPDEEASMPRSVMEQE